MIAITFALPDESRAFLAQLDNKRRIKAGALPIFRASWQSHELVILHTGIGELSSRKQLDLLFEIGTPDFLISSGFAGGLAGHLHTGDLFFAQNYSSVPFPEGFSSHIQQGKLVSQNQLVESVEEKASMSINGDAVDMETAYIHKICSSKNIPMVSLRAISDSCSEPLPVPFEAWFDLETQTPRPGTLLFFLLKNPRSIPLFCRFLNNVKHAQQRLAEGLLLWLAANEGETSPGART